MINYKSTSPRYNPNIPAIADRPRCSQMGCNEPKIVSHTYKNGNPSYSLYCRGHFNKRYYGGKSTVRIMADKLGLRPCDYVERAAIMRGFSSNAAYAKWRKENPVPERAILNTPSTKLQQIRSRIKI